MEENQLSLFTLAYWYLYSEIMKFQTMEKDGHTFDNPLATKMFQPH